MKKILFVDDEKINLMMYKIIFSNKYDVITAESGEQGLELLSEEKEVTHVFSDLKMIHMDGIKFISEAKSSYPDINYYLLTGFDSLPEISEALSKGIISNYFQKPINKELIDQTISIETNTI